MSLKIFLSNIPLLFINPSAFWKKAVEGNFGANTGIVIFTILVLVSGVAGIAGRFLYALSPPEAVDYLPEAVSVIVVPFILLLTVSLASHLFFRKYGKQSFDKSLTLSCYSILPYLLISILVLVIRDLFFFGLLGLYSVYVFANGLQIFRNIPAAKTTFLSLLVLLIVLPVYFFSDLLCRYIIVNFVLNA